MYGSLLEKSRRNGETCHLLLGVLGFFGGEIVCFGGFGILLFTVPPLKVKE